MNSFNHLLAPFATFLRHHLTEISFGIVAVVLVFLGPFINRAIKHGTQKLHWLIRFAIFVVVCSAGYGFITHVLYKALRDVLARFNNVTLIVTVFSIYLVLAWITKQQREI